MAGGIVWRMPDETVHIAADVLEKFIADVFVSLGVPRADAAVCADVLVTADKCGSIRTASTA